MIGDPGLGKIWIDFHVDVPCKNIAYQATQIYELHVKPVTSP